MRLILYGNVEQRHLLVVRKPLTTKVLEELLRGGKMLPETEEHEKILADLEELHIIAHGAGGWSPGPRMVAVNVEREETLMAMATASASRYAQLVARRVDDLKSCLRDTLPELRDRFGWAALTPVIVGAFFLDMAIGEKLYRGRVDPHTFWLLCYHSIVDSSAEAGVRLTFSENNRTAVGVFWTPRLANDNLFFHTVDVDLLHRVACAKKNVAVDLPRLLVLCHRGALHKSNYSYHLSVPFIEVGRQKALTEMILAMAEQVVGNIIEPDLQVIRSTIPELSQTLGQAYILFYNRLLLEKGLTKLVQSNLICFPEAHRTCRPGIWLWHKEEGGKFPFLEEAYA